MDKQIIAALIGAGALIIGVLIPLFKDAAVSGFKVKPRNIAGFWSGKVIYRGELEQVREITCELKQLGGKIYGSLSSLGDHATQYKVSGQFKESEFFEIAITNKNKDMLNYAIGILKLNRKASEITGQFVGRDRFDNNLVSGDIRLIKS